MVFKEWISNRLDKMEFSLVKASLVFEDRIDRLKSSFTRPRVERINWLEGAPVCIFIIYQRYLRADTRRVVEALTARGVNVVAVLTRKTAAEEQEWLRQRVSAIFSRISYGRDFAGYRTAILRLKPEILRSPRLFLLNDSIYVSSSGMDAWLDGMLKSPQAFVGATENFEGDHHLGSFSVSFGIKVIKSKYFWRFWKRYTPTNIRPHVIKRGELALCACVFKIVEHDYHVIYSVARLHECLDGKSFDADELIATRRSRSKIPWPTENFAKAYSFMAEEAVVISPPRKTKGLKLLTSGSDLAGHNVELASRFADASRRLVMESAVVGSQIHQNCMTFRTYLGMPLVKNDLYYRGVLCSEDLFKFINKFPQKERPEIESLLLFRTPGFNLTGWKRLAFLNGWL